MGYEFNNILYIIFNILFRAVVHLQLGHLEIVDPTFAWPVIVLRHGK